MGSSTVYLGAKSALASIALASTLLITGCSDGGGGSGPDFTLSDFDGNWSLHGVSFALADNTSGDGNLKGWITLNASGDVLNGNLTNSNGSAAALNGGSLSMNENGEFNGTAVAEVEDIAYNVDIYSGKMASSKELFAWVQTSSGIGINELGAAVKQGGTFVNSDLQGQWYLFGTSVEGDSDSPEGTIWGTFELDASGSVISGNISTSDEMNISNVGGAFVLDNGGKIGGTVTASYAGNEFNVSVDSGKMTASKNLMFMTSQTSGPLNSNELIAAVKKAEGAIYNPVDLSGKWYLHGVGMGSVYGKQTISGYMDVEPDGKITDGVYISTGEDLQPLQAQILSGAIYFDKNDAAVVKGSVLIQDGVDMNITITYGRLSGSKNVVVIVTEDDLDENAFIIGIKGK